MTIDIKTLIVLVGMAISALAQNLKVIQDPQTDDQTKIGIVGLLSLLGGIVIVVGLHLVNAPSTLLTWSDIYAIMGASVGVLLSTQMYHIGVNKIVDAIVQMFQQSVRSRTARARTEAMLLTEKGLA